MLTACVLLEEPRTVFLLSLFCAGPRAGPALGAKQPVAGSLAARRHLLHAPAALCGVGRAAAAGLHWLISAFFKTSLSNLLLVSSSCTECAWRVLLK